LEPCEPKTICSYSLGGGEIDFSIVVPSYNRPVQLVECLEAIAQQECPPTRYEVIVVDDATENSLELLVTPFRGRLNLTLLRQLKSGPAAARNAGALAARGRYVIFTDDDCCPDAGWLSALGDSFVTNPSCAVGGKTINALERNLYSCASQTVIDYLYGRWNKDPDDAVFVTSNNLAFPKERFLEVGGFDPTFSFAGGEDRELCHRWRSRRGRIVYTPGAIVRHYQALDLRTFLLQQFNYGRGARLFHRRISHQGIPRCNPRHAEGFLLLSLLKYASTREPGWRGIVMVILVALSQIAVSVGYLRKTFERDMKGSNQRRQRKPA
jgi:GT2 family glycosyltransferase